MSLLRKTFRYRIRPTKSQEAAMVRMADARRFVWNWGLQRRSEHYRANGNSISPGQLSSELTMLKRQAGMEWLKEAHAGSLQQALRDLDRAFRGFFEKRSRYPKFKSRKRDLLRFRVPQYVRIEGPHVVVHKIGRIRVFKSMDVDLPTSSASFKRDALGRWHVTLVAEFEMPDVTPPDLDPSKVVGIDLGLIGFATLSDGSDPIPAPKFYRKAQRNLRKAQRALSRRNPGSNRRAKARTAVAKIHRKIANRRSDFHHKLSTQLVCKYDGICIEDLSPKGMARTKLSKSVTDASFGEFRRQLEYKCLWNRKHLAVVDRWFPSSKICNDCGEINGQLTLSDRTWTCGCGVVLDRDFNAARNIRDEGLRMLAVGHTESLNARGARVRPVKAGSGR